MNKDFEAAVRTTREAFRPQTFAVGVWHGGEEHYYTFGRVSPRTAEADADTVFPIASVSKSFIAAAAWMLAEKEKIDISAPVTRYLPDFSMYTEEMTQRLTVRDTMCHCCGLPRHDITLFTREDFTLEEMVHIIRYLQPAWPIHTKFCYQNHMFAALTLLVERVSGMPWGDFVKKRIFDPLGMDRSYTKPLAYQDVDDNYARPRVQKNGRNYPIKSEDPSNCGCAGSISASVRDLLQWVKLNLRQGKSPNGDKLFSTLTAHMMQWGHTPIRPGEMTPFQFDEITNTFYGTGWFVERFRGERFVQHGGTLRGYKSFAGFLPEKDFAFAALTNANVSISAEAIGRKLCDIRLGYTDVDWDKRFAEVISEARENAFSQYQTIIEPPEQTPSLSGLPGRYENKAYGVFTVRERGGRLRLHVSNVKPMSIVPSKLFGWAADLPEMAMALPLRFEKAGERAVRLLVHLDKDLTEPVVFERLP